MVKQGCVNNPQNNTLFYIRVYLLGLHLFMLRPCNPHFVRVLTTFVFVENTPENCVY